jgi:hypothetical protein
MDQNKQDKNANPATNNSTRKSRIGHWVRVVVMCLSFGFIFPNSLTEDDDIAKQDTDKVAKAKKE